MEHAYAAIGRAVIAMQVFEVAFVSVHEGFKMITDKVYREATGGFITPEKYKNATANVVKQLKDRGDIAEDLGARINALIENRNYLMHRWFREHGWPWPDTNNAADYSAVVELAEKVRNEANAISHMMAGYMVKYAHPDVAEKDPDAYKRAMTDLFKKLHVDK
ncbi:hypothetical protein BGV71_03230 [Burkholderia ubonensis]|nr:hypothetical protein BGV71_03230 [Burkholderia ubonensis]